MARVIPVKVDISDVKEVRGALQMATERIDALTTAKKLAEHQRDLLAAAIAEHEQGRAGFDAPRWTRDGILYARAHEVMRCAPIVTRRERTLKQLLEDAVEAGLIEWVHLSSGLPIPRLTANGERWLTEHRETRDDNGGR